MLTRNMKKARIAHPARVVSRALLLSALFLSGGARQLAAAQIQFDNVDGHYLAQVYAAVQTGGVSTLYNGYNDNYGILPIGNPNFGPAVPGGLFPTTLAFMDPLTGNLGVAGSSPLGLANDYATVAYAQFAIAMQFNQAGIVSLSMHVPGSVGAAAVNPPADYAYAQMQASVAIVDDSLISNASSAGTKLCISRFNGVYGILCSTPLTVNQTFVATLHVVPGHVYTLSATEWGDESSYGTFDGIDPVSLSLQLDPGMSIVPVAGLDLPGFLGGPTGSSSAPEPATWGLIGCAMAILAGCYRARLGPHHTTALTGRFGSVRQPLATAPGSEPSRDREGAVPDETEETTRSSHYCFDRQVRFGVPTAC
ncbi:MAG: hypothetical protein KGN36_19450 [Acidobacteriota bacterium]|nr:hypothetical protein [Acidobacteriota bacterium]